MRGSVTRVRGLWALGGALLWVLGGLARAQEAPRPGLDVPKLRVAVADFRAVGGDAAQAKQLSAMLRTVLAAHPQLQVVSGGTTAGDLAAAESDILSLKEGAARAIGDKLGVDAVIYGKLVGDASVLLDDPLLEPAKAFVELAVAETLTLDGQLYPGVMIGADEADLPAKLAAAAAALLPAPGKVLALVESPEGSVIQLFPLGGRVLAPGVEYGVYGGLAFRAGDEDTGGRSSALARQDLRPGALVGRVRTSPAAGDHLVTATSVGPAGTVKAGQLVGLVAAGVTATASAPTLIVAASPADTVVLVDGMLAGVTPVAVSLRADQRALVSLRRRDYKPVTQTITAGAGEGVALFPTLEELAPVGGLRVVTTPPGATVTLGGKEQGKSPFTSDAIAAGEQVLAVDLEGYKAVRQAVTIRRQRATEVTLALQKDYRRVRVLSEPDGARVLVDGQGMGATPLDIGALQTGAHELRLTLPGYAVETQNVKVGPGDAEQVLRVRMRAVAGNLRVESDPPGASVALDGQDKGKTPLALTGLGVGAHRVDIALDGYLAATRTVEVQDQRTAEVVEALVRAEGRILCASVPGGAAINLDGKDAGTTPTTLEHVASGKRQLSLTLEGYQPWSGRVPVLNGETTKVEVGLIREGQGGTR